MTDQWLTAQAQAQEEKRKKSRAKSRDEVYVIQSELLVHCNSAIGVVMVNIGIRHRG